MTNWNKRFMALAEHVATWSKDPSKGVGAIIADDLNRVKGIGYNGFPRGVADTQERYADRATKLGLVCHAERNALDNTTHSVEGHTMYATYFPCAECAKSIKQRGITTIVTREPDMESVHNKEFRWDISKIIFEESGVEVIYVE